MPNDLDQMFAALSADTDRRPTLAAETLRTRTDRRGRAKTAVTGTALAVVVAGAVFAGQALLTGRPAQPPVVPSVPSPSVSAPPVPTSIPATAFLRAADVNDDEGGTERQDDILPGLCGATYPSRDAVAVRKTLHFEFRTQGLPLDYIADGVLEETVTVYRGDGAERFLAEVEAAVAGCPEQDDAKVGLGAAPKAGDQSLLVEQSYQEPANPDEPENLVTVTDRAVMVRQGDTVIILNAHGWEGGGVQAATMAALAKAAAARVDAWR